MSKKTLPIMPISPSIKGHRELLIFEYEQKYNNYQDEAHTWWLRHEDIKGKNEELETFYYAMYTVNNQLMHDAYNSWQFYQNKEDEKLAHEAKIRMQVAQFAKEAMGIFN